MTTLLEDLVRDVAYALRSLRRQRTFAAASIGVLALAIGGNTAVFSLVDATLLRPLPFADPARLVTVTYETPGTPATSLPSRAPAWDCSARSRSRARFRRSFSGSRRSISQRTRSRSPRCCWWGWSPA